MEEKFGGDSKASFEKVTNEICTHLNNIYKEEGWWGYTPSRLFKQLASTDLLLLGPDPQLEKLKFKNKKKARKKASTT